MQYGISFCSCTKGHHGTTVCELESAFGLQDGHLTESLSAMPVVSLNLLKCTR